MPVTYFAIFLCSASLSAAYSPGDDDLFCRSGEPAWGRLTTVALRSPVQKELGLDIVQAEAMTVLMKRLEGLHASSREARRELDAARILTPKQAARLQQVRIQVLGAAAIFDPEVADALTLTGRQREQLASARRSERDVLKDQLASQRFESYEDEKTFMIDFWRTNRQFDQFLGAEQKEKLRRMSGDDYPGINELVTLAR